MSDHSYSTALETAASIAAKEVSSRELLEAALSRVERLDGPINAVVALDAERALEAANRADEAVARGDELGPLHGVPITIKDSFQTEGLTTTSGAPELAQFVPDKDADPVARYKDAGAIVYGKTNLPIWAGYLQSYNKVYGATANPYDIECTPGGSSGGSSAALAAGTPHWSWGQILVVLFALLATGREYVGTSRVMGLSQRSVKYQVCLGR